MAEQLFFRFLRKNLEFQGLKYRIMCVRMGSESLKMKSKK